MSVLGSIFFLNSIPAIDRWGNLTPGETVQVHAATTMGIYVHVSLSRYDENGAEIAYAEVQLSTSQARELGSILARWADNEDERILKDLEYQRKNDTK